MAENQTESSPLESEELPVPSFSEKGDSSTSSGADDLVSKLIAQLEPLIDKKVQSVKDKRFSEIEKVLGGRDRMLAELEASGVTIPKEVRQEMRLRELEERLTQSPAQPAQPRDDGSSQATAAVTEAIAELKGNGLTTDDPAFIEILRGRYASREAFDLQVQRYINQKLRPAKPANPADVVQSPARMGAQDNDSTLRAEYEKRKAALPRGNVRAISNLQAEFRKKGLDL
jgi:hypothetical protein